MLSVCANVADKLATFDLLAGNIYGVEYNLGWGLKRRQAHRQH
jgi:hypothetical protein